MSRRFSISIVLVASLVLILGTARTFAAGRAATLGRSASAQNPSSFTLDGKITEAEPGKITLNTEENMLFHVRYEDKTEIKRADGSDGSAKDLRVGVRVHVEGELEQSGEIAAAKITLQEQGSKKPQGRTTHRVGAAADLLPLLIIR
jgi:Domain of unknown function (DUF5666)